MQLWSLFQVRLLSVWSMLLKRVSSTSSAMRKAICILICSATIVLCGSWKPSDEVCRTTASICRVDSPPNSLVNFSTQKTYRRIGWLRSTLCRHNWDTNSETHRYLLADRGHRHCSCFESTGLFLLSATETIKRNSVPFILFF